MEISSLQIVLVFLVGCLSGMGSILDEFQTHRPLIACTLTGLVLGDMTTGIIIGGTLEMMALGWMNIGAALAPDAALASIISTILVIAGKQEMGTGIALAIPLAAAGQVLTILVRTITVGTNAVKEMLDAIPPVVTGGLNVAGGMIVVVGYAMVINMMRAPHLMMFFFVGFVVAAFTNFNLVALGVLGVAIAFFYIQMHPKYHKGSGGSAQAATAQPNKLDNQLD